MRNIILIGMPGSGKTTFGKAIAERLGRPFIDADDYYGEDISDTPIQIGTTLSELQEVNAQMVHLLTGDNNPAIQTGNPTLAGSTDQLGKTRPEAPKTRAYCFMTIWDRSYKRML